jgi:hypothetical protein
LEVRRNFQILLPDTKIIDFQNLQSLDIFLLCIYTNILYLFLLFSLSLQAQTEEKVSLGNDSTEVDSTATAKPSAFKRAIKKFMNFSDFDTLYISPNRYNYALMVTHFSNFEYYSITSELPQPQKLSFSPNPHNKIE